MNIQKIKKAPQRIDVSYLATLGIKAYGRNNLYPQQARLFLTAQALVRNVLTVMPDLSKVKASQMLPSMTLRLTTMVTPPMTFSRLLLKIWLTMVALLFTLTMT